MMEHNDPVMTQWKEELGQLKLSNERKLSIEEAIVAKPKKRWSPVAIVAPFALAIIVFLILAGMPNTDTTATNSKLLLFTLQPITGELIAWGAGIDLFVVTNYLLMSAVVQKVGRIQHVKIFEAFKERMNTHQIWQLVAATIFFVALGWAMVLILPFGLLAVQLYAGLLFIPFVTFIQLLMTRNAQWPVCGHCGEVVSKRAMRKHSYGKTPHCDYCEKPLYEKYNSRKSGVYFFSFLPIFTPFITELVEWPALIFYIFVFLLLVFTTIKYINPYVIQFTDDDHIPPLW